MAGFRFLYRMNGEDPTVETLPFKNADGIHAGDLVNLEEGKVRLAATADSNLLGAAKQTKDGAGSTTFLQIVTDADAVYAVTDDHARGTEDSLDLTGTTGVQGVREGPNNDLTVILDSAATEETLVRIATGRHAHDRLGGGELNAALARAVVRIHRNHIGRGASRAQAFFHNDVIVVLMRGVMTKPERTLAASGQRDAVLGLRHRLQRTMRSDLAAAVERLTGCRVTAAMSDRDIDSDMAVQLFVLDRPVPGQRLEEQVRQNGE